MKNDKMMRPHEAHYFWLKIVLLNPLFNFAPDKNSPDPKRLLSHIGLKYPDQNKIPRDGLPRFRLVPRLTLRNTKSDAKLVSSFSLLNK